MTRPKRTRRDANQAQIINDLTQLGAYVVDTADLGGQCLDLLVSWRGLCLPVEVKQPGKENDLTDGEREAIEAHRSRGVYAFVATSAEDVIARFKTDWFGDVEVDDD